MRSLLALALLSLMTAVAVSQPPVPVDPNPPRFGLPYRPKEYPQASPKEALESVIAAVGNGDYNYLVAHLLDPQFVDARVGRRADQFIPAVEDELGRLREFQLQYPETVNERNKVPERADLFKARVKEEAARRAFTRFVRDVESKLTDDPEVLKDFRRFNRQGSFPEAAAAGMEVKVGHPDIRDRAVFLKKIGERWYVENRQAEEKAPEPKKE